MLQITETMHYDMQEFKSRNRAERFEAEGDLLGIFARARRQDARGLSS